MFDSTPILNCDLQDCPIELLHPPEDCNVNASLSFTLQVLTQYDLCSYGVWKIFSFLFLFPTSVNFLFQICRVEDISVEGHIKGSIVHFHRARTITVQSSGVISASSMGMLLLVPV